MSQLSGAATLPRGFRYSDSDGPKTPEPQASYEEARIPSPPRPRLRLKRRIASNLNAPTQHFLASVAAADVPIPSIEEPEAPVSMDFELSGPVDDLASPFHPSEQRDRDMLSLPTRGRGFSPPKTPAPGYVPSLSPSRYPNWSIDSAISSLESTPDYESSRPSTSRSTHTSASLFSRISQLSDDDHCLSPESEHAEKFAFLVGHDGAATIKAKPRKAPWTKAMSAHLWATYVLYLQDPKVTPFRMGKSCIPPHGVCLRVAREAKRSWKGSKGPTKADAVGGGPSDGRKSGSSTPTAETSAPYMQWPHSWHATRAHLRELCKLKAASGGRNFHVMSSSPTPFTQAAARHWNRRSTPARSPSVFGTSDISMSLAMSTSDTMQPQGPLAQLTSSESVIPPVEHPSTPSTAPRGRMLSTFEGEPSFAERRRLGSPFRSYGPSSSASLATALGLASPMPRRQTHTMGPRRVLQSPVRMSRSGTQKRRNTQSSEPRKRPSLALDLWTDPNTSAVPAADVTRSRGFTVSHPSQRSDIFGPSIQAGPTLSSSTSMPDFGPELTPAAAAAPAPPRLGSPFPGKNSSFSFPNRLRHPMSVDLGALGRPFATIQQAPEAANPPSRGTLASRLAYIDQRLKEFRSRDGHARSQSPM